MKIKSGVEASSSDFWYDVNEGYLEPEALLEEQRDVVRVLEAIKTLKEFEDSLDEQVPGFVQ